MAAQEWYTVNNVETIPSPALLVYPERIEENIRTMISMAGGFTRLRPHIKTHKTAEIVQMQQRHGIQKFKCATVAEAELLGNCGAKDVLLAMQPVAVNIDRFFSLMKRFPETYFSTLVDNLAHFKVLATSAENEHTRISLYMDINNGMDRTGCPPDETAVALYRAMEEHSHVTASGIHVYDGHIRDSDIAERKARCDAAYESVTDLINTIKNEGITVPHVVAGGSPSFPIHSKRPHVESSPGTTLLWDVRYGDLFPDMHFLHAAVLLVRVISKPGKDLLCFDLGHKWVAPEMGFPRVKLLGLEGSEQVGHSEEHLIVKTQKANEYAVGDALYALPIHICPTAAKYKEVRTISDHEQTGTWEVVARDQRMTI